MTKNLCYLNMFIQHFDILGVYKIIIISKSVLQVLDIWLQIV